MLEVRGMSTKTKKGAEHAHQYCGEKNPGKRHAGILQSGGIDHDDVAHGQKSGDSG